jgi:peptide-methionine (S)-S-oxide reductase
MEQKNREVAILAGGCFGCLEAVFERLEGVETVESGYVGGNVPNPTYQQICRGTTGHAEAVQVTFDPHTISYCEILEVFFAIHDPTTLNRQGNDVGTQYRSAIFYRSPEQRETATHLIAELGSQNEFGRPLVTEVVPAPTFYKAEDYHQRYFVNNEAQPYCQLVVAPKLAKFKKKFADHVKR